MTRPLRPVYLALPSSRTDDSAVLCSGFVDELARRPQVDDDVLLGIVEFATFVNELAPLGGSLEQCAGAQVSGFRGVDYAGLFDGLALLLDYDAYRLSSSAIRVGHPVVVMVLDTPPASDDDWRASHRKLCSTEMFITAVCLGDHVESFADAVAIPSGHRVRATDAHHAARAAAAAVAAQVWGIG